jgi:hypothetical protein
VSFKCPSQNAGKAWLPDFSWYNMPKQGEIYQITANGYKIYQMDIKYNKCHQIFQQLPSQIYPIWDFWFENIASGNPGKV